MISQSSAAFTIHFFLWDCHISEKNNALCATVWNEQPCVACFALFFGQLRERSVFSGGCFTFLFFLFFSFKVKCHSSSHTMQIVCQPCDSAHEMSEINGIRSLYKDVVVIPDLSSTLLLLHLCCAVKAKWVIALKTSVQRFLSLGKAMALIDDDTLLMKADISLICYHNCFCFH